MKQFGVNGHQPTFHTALTTVNQPKTSQNLLVPPHNGFIIRFMSD
jgi:hypothetical protein